MDLLSVGLKIIVALLICSVWGVFQRKNINKRIHGYCTILFITYIIELVSITLWPKYRYFAGDDIILSYNLVPFQSILGALTHSYWVVGARNVLGNIIMFVPLGFFCFLFLKKENLRTFEILLIGFFTSLAIEGTQLLMSVLKISIRTFDIDDLILNTLGCLMGYGIYIIVNKILSYSNRTYFKTIKSVIE